MHWMIMPFKRYADFSGRSQRKEYWMFILLNFVIILSFFIFIGSQGESGDTAKSLGGLAKERAEIAVNALMLYFLIIFIPSLAVGVRRLHDQDKSGWLMLLSFIPYIGSGILLWFMMTDGTPGTNRYGPDPKGRYAGNDDDGDIDEFSTIDFSSGSAPTPPARVV